MPEGDTQGEKSLFNRGREIALAVKDNARHPLDLARGAGNQPVLVTGAYPEEGE